MTCDHDWYILFEKKNGRIVDMVPISIEKFARMTCENNEDLDYKDLIRSLEETLAAKENGAKCVICGSPIWAAGSALTGTDMCFTCATGEADDSQDYEIGRE